MIAEAPQPDPLDAALTRALQAAPHVSLPDDFAQRVLAQLPATPPARRPLPAFLPATPSIGRRAAFGALILLLITMLAFALPASSANPLVRLSVEGAATAEFALLTVWLSLRPPFPLRD